MRTAEAARAESIAVGSPVNEVWAQSILAQLHLRRDVAAGVTAVTSALEAARQVDYPAAVAANLRALAWAHVRAGNYRFAATTLSELSEDVIARGGVAEIRGILLTTADLLHAVGSDCWEPLAATALSLPLVGPTNSTLDAMAQLPPPRAIPLNRRDAVAIVRRELKALVTGDPAAPHGDQAQPDADRHPITRVTVPGPGRFTDDTAQLVDHGQFWEVRFTGRNAHLKASKGLTDIVRLVSAPRREIHCTELMGSAVDESSSGEAFDQQARRVYEQRIRDLQDDIGAAEADNDIVRADRARAEVDTLVDYLTAALGLGGRTRRIGGSAERARSAVTQRIRATIRSVATVHPEFGRHLEKSVSTGSFCAYRPEITVDWRVS